MAEFDELDELLSGSLKRAAQPGDSAGVADTIRARVAAGDTGTTAPSGYAPEFGSGFGWIPWVGVIVVLGLVGGTLGVTGAFGRPPAPQPVSNAVLTSLAGDTGVDGLNCPTGSPITELQPGQHVIALARTEDSADIEVRDPAALNQTVWVTAHALKSLGKDFSTLPLSGCGVLTSTAVPAPVVVTPVVPVTPVKPGPPKDTTPPSVGKPTVDNPPNYACYARVSVTASDNVGVTSVSITWTGSNSGSGHMTATGGHWEYMYAGSTSNTYSGPMTFAVVAHDAAGNSSPANSATYYMQCFG